MYRAKRKKIKFRRPRIRCPLCGFLGWLSCFLKDHPVEMKLQYTRGGRGKRDFVSYTDVYDRTLLQGTRDYLSACCKTAAFRLDTTIFPENIVPRVLDEAARLEVQHEVLDVTTKKLKELATQQLLTRRYRQ